MLMRAVGNAHAPTYPPNVGPCPSDSSCHHCQPQFLIMSDATLFYVHTYLPAVANSFHGCRCLAFYTNGYVHECLYRICSIITVPMCCSAAGLLRTAACTMSAVRRTSKHLLVSVRALHTALSSWDSGPCLCPELAGCPGLRRVWAAGGVHPLSMGAVENGTAQAANSGAEAVAIAQ